MRTRGPCDLCHEDVYLHKLYQRESVPPYSFVPFASMCRICFGKIRDLLGSVTALSGDEDE